MPDSRPLVSIVTPSYNQAAYLENTLRSVLAQDYQRVEYIVVDGGSTDNSAEIISKRADKLAWWVSEKDNGQADGINKGLRRARGEIVAWLNSDDLYLPGAISQAVTALQANPSLGLVYGDAITIDAQGQPLNILKFGDWGLEELMRFRIVCQPAVFMRREALLEAGFLDESYHFMLDHHLWLRIASYYPIRHIPRLWAAARHHPAAKNVSQAADFSREITRLVNWMENTPELRSEYQKNRRYILGGAQRLSGRYLLDGGAPGPALAAYGKALVYSPAYALQHWHRMIFACLSLVGLKSLGSWYLRAASRPDLSGYPQLTGWPGLSLEAKHA